MNDKTNYIHNKKSDTITETLEVIEYNLERGLYVRHAQVKILFEEYKKLKKLNKE